MSAYHVLNLGCKVNRVESDALERLFEQEGMHASGLEDADIVVVNTCTVTGEAEKKARKLVRHALRVAKRAKVIVTGCASAISPDTFDEMSERVEVVPKALLDGYLRTVVGDVEKRCIDAECNVAHAYLPSRSRLGVKIQDGCDNSCTYCIVCKARGPSSSVDHLKVLDDVRKLKDLGIKEILLTGIDLGAYEDIASDGKSFDLPRLLEVLLEETDEANRSMPEALQAQDAACVIGDKVAAPSMDDPYFARTPLRFRISSIEPGNVSDRLIDLIASSNGRICRHLHIPLQSGSNKVLEEMDRHYSAEDYICLISKLRDAIPSISITTDMIVGFPGETEEDFQESMDAARKSGFSNIHVFPYSRREGTKAASRTDQVPAVVRSQRATRLRSLARLLRSEDAHRREGTTEIYCIQDDGNMMSESYYEMSAPKGSSPGELIEAEFIIPENLR